MSQVSQQTPSLGLCPTGVALLGRTEFLRRMTAGEKALDINLSAMETRDKETQKLIAIISDEMAANGAECFQIKDCMEVYISGMDRDEAADQLNDYIAEHAPMFHQGNMEFEFDEEFNGTNRFIMNYQSNVA